MLRVEVDEALRSAPGDFGAVVRGGMLAVPPEFVEALGGPPSKSAAGVLLYARALRAVLAERLGWAPADVLQAAEGLSALLHRRVPSGLFQQPAGLTADAHRPDAEPGERASAARHLALGLMVHHGLVAWRFAFNRRKCDLGLCVFPHGGRPGRIELSLPFVDLNPLEEVRDVVLHEIAHALVGPGHGHDVVWRAKCREAGARPERCGQAVMPQGRWRAACPGCGRTYHRHRRPEAGYHCEACGPIRGALSWVATS